MWPDSVTLNRESRLDWTTNDGSVYTGGSHHSVNRATTCIYIFHRRTDDIPLTQLGEIRSWIKDGQRRLAFLVGNFYNELVCNKIFLESEDIRTFTTCPAVGAFKNDVWRLIWQYLPTCSRWKITTRQSDRLPRAVAEVERQCLDKINITFLMDMPECTRNTIIVGALGLGLLVHWPESVEIGVQLKFL
ncbi:hypothetical protein B0H14DRAFT_3147093 [Mycena olivaceomarginata]|nr:hypothetical protein B0H14DRAFT_3147093 [Mycena olivaceomarginata]